MFGTMIENELAVAEQNAPSAKFATSARAQVLNRHLNPGSSAGVFKDPMASLAPSEKDLQPSEQELGGSFLA